MPIITFLVSLFFSGLFSQHLVATDKTHTNTTTETTIRTDKGGDDRDFIITEMDTP